MRSCPFVLLPFSSIDDEPPNLIARCRWLAGNVVALAHLAAEVFNRADRSFAISAKTLKT